MNSPFTISATCTALSASIIGSGIWMDIDPTASRVNMIARSTIVTFVAAAALDLNLNSILAGSLGSLLALEVTSCVIGLRGCYKDRLCAAGLGAIL